MLHSSRGAVLQAQVLQVLFTSRLQNAISGSIIQNSAKCLLVWLFSALKVGPKV